MGRKSMKKQGKFVRMRGSIVEVDLLPELREADRRREDRAIDFVNRRVTQRRKENHEDNPSDA